MKIPFFILIVAGLIGFGKISSAQNQILNDKTDQIQTFIKTNKIDFKSDRDQAKLFTYYNSL